MKYDILLAGVGGQGVLSMAALIGRAAIAGELRAKQSEVHGMAQRGGAVQAHLRLADGAIASDLIPAGAADLILSLEPVESLRYLAWLSPSGTIVTSSSPFPNFPGYPDVGLVLGQVRKFPHAVVVDAELLAREAGDPLTVNTVMVGAASHVLPVSLAALERAVDEMFARKGDAVVELNRRAFRAGREAAQVAGAAR